MSLFVDPSEAAVVNADRFDEVVGWWEPGTTAVLALGPLACVTGGRIDHAGGPRQQLVLALLLEAGGTSVSSERLIDGIWGDRPPQSARGTLHSYISNLRALLGDVVTGDGSTYRAAVTVDNFDVMLFESLVMRARDSIDEDPATGAELIRTGLNLFRGDPYAGLRDSPSVQNEAHRLEELRLGAVEDCIDAELAVGRHCELVSELEVLVADHPLRERFLRQLMLALYRCGRHVEAVHAYQRARKLLLEESGVGLSRDIRILRTLILEQNPELDL